MLERISTATSTSLLGTWRRLLSTWHGRLDCSGGLWCNWSRCFARRSGNRLRRSEIYSSFPRFGWLDYRHRRLVALCKLLDYGRKILLLPVLILWHERRLQDSVHGS